jgi:tetratricopeptide (TPR) repeat protein
MNPDDQNLPGLQLIDAAVEIASFLETRERDQIAVVAAANYAAIGLLDDAIRSAEEISDSYLRDTAIARMAVNVIEREPETDVLSLVESIEDPGIQNLALGQLSVRYAELNLFDTALEVSRRLEDPDPALANVIPLIAEKHSLEQSGELVDELNDSNLRTTCLIELATIAEKSSRHEQAEHFLIQAEAEAENQPTDDRIMQLIAIADVYDELNQTQKQTEILLRAFRLCNEIEGPTDADFGKNFGRDELLVHVAGGLAKCQQYKQSDLAIEKIEGPLEFARAASQQAAAYHEDGQDAQALKLLSEASELVTTQPSFSERSLYRRDVTLHVIALAFGTIRDFKKGSQEALLISNHEQRLITQTELGKKAALAGSTDSIFEIHGCVDGAHQRAAYLLAVCDALLKNGNKELAVKLLLKAIEDSDEIQRADQRCLTLIQISFGLIESGLEPTANQLLLTVLETAVNIQDGYQQAQILLAMAEQYHQHARELSSSENQILEKLAIASR